MDQHYSEILGLLEERETITSNEVSVPGSILHGVLLSLESKNQVSFKIEDRFEKFITPQGKDVINNGSPEFNLFQALKDEENDIYILEKYPNGSNYAFKNKWIALDQGIIKKLKSKVEDDIAHLLKKLNLTTDKEFAELRKRKLADQKKEKIYIIRRGPEFGKMEKLEVELTAEHVQNFRNEKFKKYNFDTVGNIPLAGSLHPLLKIREEVKKIFLEMGFSEMNTNRYVESSFWNFDSLFQPQCHPARDAHDTFFLKVPATSEEYNREYLTKVQEVHEKGGYGSIGHQTKCSKMESMKNILRTHTTAISSRCLKAMSDNFKPSKLFSIDKVFRNESVDATHLAEFHQVEGLIAGYNLGVGDLMGFMGTFFNRLGLKDIKFKPAFNPYTEPSMEVFGYHEGLGKWIEIGNSGIFRPEMLRPMGLDKDIVVIAWGLSLERPAMIKYGLKNIRDLVGHKVDVNFIKKCEFINF